MPPKKKEEPPPPPQPEELLPAGFSINCQVFWSSFPQQLGEQGGGVVRLGSRGTLVAATDLVEAENEEGEKEYSLEVVDVLFEGHAEAQKAVLKSLTLRPPPREEMWNLKPLLETSRVNAVADSENVCSVSPFVQAISVLDCYPRRADKVEHLLEPALAEFLNSTDFQYSSNSFGNHDMQGWIDWRSIFPWVEGVLQAANAQAKLTPELTIDMDVYTMLIRRFDKKNGQFISNCPLSENILPFAKYVVTLRYLELQEAARNRAEREREIRELLVSSEEASAANAGRPRIAAAWDTPDGLRLEVLLPDGLGELQCSESEDAGEVDLEATQGDAAMAPPPRSLARIAWALYDPAATGEDAVLCPPPGEYRVRLHVASRRTTIPCHWACQVTFGDEPQVFGGTWLDGDETCIEIGTFAFAEPQ
eukprot:TRINITY_DN38269_c0_g1_i1.p1 TRINITY_DN38269_c0_g1~~TRINITY_DN38269_c0_g1_i1.p1  ORF type:complete len:420 (+),score=96.13 TRINITY_DN38269_c0_g1_i1:56-1315(+)